MIRLLILAVVLSFEVKRVSLFDDLELSNNQVVTVIEKETSFESKMTNTFKACNITDSLTIQIYIAQAKLESGNFKNNLTRNHNNIFSMRHPSRRPTTSIGPLASAEKRSGYASYESIEQATTDFILYLEYCNYPDTIKSVESHVKLLKQKGYFESSTKSYTKAIKRLLK
jgi:flagellum-specific peptidoglycan hydrolase FlgJ